MIVIEDSMVLIFLAKLDLIKETKSMFGNVVIAEEVERETILDTRLYPDAIRIEESIDKGFVEVKKVKNGKKVNEIMKSFGLGKGEAATIQLYFQENADLLLCDEKKARKVAQILKINMLGTPELVVKLHKRKFINNEKAKESIIKLEKIGWFNPSIIFETLKEIGD